MTEIDYQKVMQGVESFIINRKPERELQMVADFLHASFPRFDWVGFYIVTGSRSLRLGPFCGAPTEHVEIEFGQGICGQAAGLGKTFIVPDVNLESNYLSCSIKVKSEIVLPIFLNHRLVAELDIDSHTLDAFSSSDNIFLEQVCKSVAPLFHNFSSE